MIIHNYDSCINCIHKNVCAYFTIGVPIENRECDDFTDKSEWIHLPCKVGDTIFGVISDENGGHIETAEVKTVTLYSYGIVIDTWETEESNVPMAFGEIGKWVFATKEEAEKALAERSK